MAAATFSGSGRLQLLLHAATTYKDAAVVAVLCARRLRERLGMRDLWAPNLDLVIGESAQGPALQCHKRTCG